MYIPNGHVILELYRNEKFGDEIRKYCKLSKLMFQVFNLEISVNEQLLEMLRFRVGDVSWLYFCMYTFNETMHRNM